MEIGSELSFEFGGASAATPQGPDTMAQLSVINPAAALGSVSALGRDISAIAGLDPNFTLVSGQTAVSQAIARRLTTQRGTLFYDPNYGTDVREILAAKIDQRRLEDWRARIEAEVKKDERVLSVAASLRFDPTVESLTIRIMGTLSTGPFTLTLAVSAVTVELLPVG